MCPPPLVSEGRGPHLGAQQASWARVGGANTFISSPAPPVCSLGGPLPPAPPILPGLSPKPPGPMQGQRKALGGQGTSLGLSRLPMSEWAGQSPSDPLWLLPEGPSHQPLLFSGWPPSYVPKDPRSLEGAWRAADWPGSSAGSLCQSGWGNHPLLLTLSSWRAPPTCLS